MHRTRQAVRGGDPNISRHGPGYGRFDVAIDLAQEIDSGPFYLTERIIYMVRVGSARSNEYGGITGGKPGDQKGGAEVSMQTWYLHNKGWIVIRAKDPTSREKIAQNMVAACLNNHIGYCQSHRETATEAAKPYGYDFSKITTDVETDCSELVRACCLYAGIKVGSFSTGNEAAALQATGKFQILKDDKYCTSSKFLLRGDILVTRTKGHTVVVLDNGCNALPASGNKSGWQHDAHGWWWQNADGTWVVSDWRLINHHWYLFGANGYIRKGWHRWNPATKQVDPSDGSGDWYYLQEDGDLQGACWHSRSNGAMEVWYVDVD